MDVDGTVIDELAADTVQSTASIGQIFLLVEAAERIADGRLDPARMVRRDPRVAVGDSGLWQHLTQDELPLADVCLLVGAVSDNWATNVLLDIVGLDAVQARAAALGCTDSGLRDHVRMERTESDPPTLSTGTARELAEVGRRIHLAAEGGQTAGVSPEAARLTRDWLLAGVDLSMVAAPFRLDPLAHTEDRVLLWSKTGTDLTIRADMGVTWGGGDAVAYAALATWEPDDDVEDEPFARMHALGSTLAARMWWGA